MTVVPFQSFPGGKDDSDVKSWPIPGHVQAFASGGMGGGSYGRFTADGTTTNGDGTIRVHNWSDGNLFPMMQPGQVCWVSISIRLPSGYTNQAAPLYAGYEMHQSSRYGTTGPAPLNLTTDGVGHPWHLIIRGENARGLNGVGFHQTEWGRAAAPSLPFAGGVRNTVADQWVAFLLGRLIDYTGNGWVEMWMRAQVDAAWTNVVPRHSGIYTSYNNQNFPMASLYADIRDGLGSRAIDFCNGGIGDDFQETLDYANRLNGFTVAPAPPPADTAKILIGKAENELAHTTITYPDWKQRVDSGYYAGKKINPATGTGWGRAFAYLDAAKSIS